jgi:hypothetical protein
VYLPSVVAHFLLGSSREGENKQEDMWKEEFMKKREERSKRREEISGRS